MKQILLGFLLGVVVCLSMGAELYRPVRGFSAKSDAVPESALYKDHMRIMMNQEAIYNLVNAKCSSK
jgi:hypothetical protein